MGLGLMCTEIPLESVQIGLSVPRISGQPQRGGRVVGVFRFPQMADDLLDRVLLPGHLDLLISSPILTQLVDRKSGVRPVASTFGMNTTESTVRAR